jgi:hypothetical protein
MTCFSTIGREFFPHYRARPTEEIEAPPPLPKEEEMKPDPVRPIHIDDAQYALLTRALRPESARVCKDLESGPNISPIVEKADQPSADQPPGTPIV